MGCTINKINFHQRASIISVENLKILTCLIFGFGVVGGPSVIHHIKGLCKYYFLLYKCRCSLCHSFGVINFLIINCKFPFTYYVIFRFSEVISGRRGYILVRHIIPHRLIPHSPFFSFIFTKSVFFRKSSKFKIEFSNLYTISYVWIFLCINGRNVNESLDSHFSGDFWYKFITICT